MSNYTDRATVDLFVNGEQPTQTIERLTKLIADYKQQLQAANAAGDFKKRRVLILFRL